MSKVWFITGASKGFGREWSEAALESPSVQPARLRIAAVAVRTGTTLAHRDQDFEAIASVTALATHDLT